MELREALGVEALQGHNTGNLEPPSNVVRVFISSTISGWAFTHQLFFTVPCNCTNLALKDFFLQFYLGKHKVDSSPVKDWWHWSQLPHDPDRQVVQIMGQWIDGWMHGCG